MGLGKSFIALALMEHYCRQGQNVLLIAPKNVMDTSWNEYLPKYLGEYMAPDDNVTQRPMTFLGSIRRSRRTTRKE